MLSNRNILSGSCERVGAGTHRYARFAALGMFVACSFELLGKGRSVAEDGSFPVDYIDCCHENERDAEEDRRCVGEGIRADVWRNVSTDQRRQGVNLLLKKGVAGTVSTPARKSLDHPLPPVAEAE